MTPDGYNVGSLCAMDDQPRVFSVAEISILKNFAKLVVDELELRQVLSTDQLTGAMSRTAWFGAAANEVTRARRYNRALCLLVLDIDYFKSVNDQLGHTAGDAVLRRVAEVVQGQLRQSDVLGRFGGEEFVVLLPESVLADATVLAERVREAVKQASYPGNGDLRCTISIGVAELSQSEQNIGKLFERADSAVLRAKTNGRNRVEICGGDQGQTALNVAA
jgi:diguanylate cyclase (GGDEF)-like protein